MTEPFTEDTEAHIVSAIELVTQGKAVRIDAAELADEINTFLASVAAHPSMAAYMTEAERAAMAPVVDLNAHRVVSRAATRRRLGL